MPPAPFVRDRLTYAAYAASGVFTMLLGFIGPLMPHLRAELNLGYAEAALHTSAFALGMSVCGLVGERVVDRIGRGRTMWLSLAGMAAGLSMVALARSAAVSIAGCGVMGLLGTMMLVVVPALLSERHGDNRGFAFSEQNIAAYCGALFAPLLVWAFAVGLTWRWSGFVGWIVLAAFAAAFARVSYPPGAPAASGPAATLPRGYWAFWTLLLITVATEFCVLVWSSSYLESVIGLSREQAVLSTAVFPTAMILARVAGAFMLRKIRVGWLVLPSLTLGFVGFMLFWQAPSPAIGLVGLFVTGLGIANLYPAGMALAMTAAGPAVSAAAARASLGSGIAIILAPLTLGALADRYGIAVAYGAVPFLFAIGVLSYSIGRRSPAR